MMAGNPNWWSMHPPNSLYPSHDQFVQLGSSSSIPFNSLPDHTQEHGQTWSQFLLGGLSSEEDRLDLSHFQQKKLENWEEDEILNNPILQTRLSHDVEDVVKQEDINLQKDNLLYGQGYHEELMQSTITTRHINNKSCNWLQVMPVSSPVRSCITSTTTNLGTITKINNILDFSFNNNKLLNSRNNPTPPDQSSECNSTASGGVCKKARIQPTSIQQPLKVRKEKLGDRITALHQLVSPFGKTDTASVLLETIGYIRFLQTQIEALSSPYLGNASKHTRNQHYVENGVKAKDLRSRGLCLVPLSYTQHVGSDSIGADYWPPVCDGRF